MIGMSSTPTVDLEGLSEPDDDDVHDFSIRIVVAIDHMDNMGSTVAACLELLKELEDSPDNKGQKYTRKLQTDMQHFLEAIVITSIK